MPPRVTPTDLLAWSIENRSEEPQPLPPSHTIDTKWMEILLGKPESARMKEIAQELSTSDVPAKIQLFDELEMLIESIDNANDLGPLNIWPILLQQLQDSHPDVRKYAAWVMATATQNNPKAQADFTRNSGFEHILGALKTESSLEVKQKIVYCVSSAVRNSLDNFEKFAQLNGFRLLADVCVNGEQDLTKRFVFLFNHLLGDEEVSTKTIHYLTESGVIDMIISLLEQHDLSDDVVECIVTFLYYLKESKDGKELVMGKVGGETLSEVRQRVVKLEDEILVKELLERLDYIMS